MDASKAGVVLNDIKRAKRLTEIEGYLEEPHVDWPTVCGWLLGEIQRLDGELAELDALAAGKSTLQAAYTAAVEALQHLDGELAAQKEMIDKLETWLVDEANPDVHRGSTWVHGCKAALIHLRRFKIDYEL